MAGVNKWLSIAIAVVCYVILLWRDF